MSLEDASIVYRFGPFAFQPRDGLLVRDGRRETLQPRVGQALEFLLQRPGRLVTREELIAALWGDAFIQEGTLNQVVSKLRRALSDDRAEPHYIETRFKRGYRFLAEVRVEPAAPGLQAVGEAGGPAGLYGVSAPVAGREAVATGQPAAARGEVEAPARRRRSVAIAAAAAAVILVGIAAFLATRRAAPRPTRPGLPGLVATRLTFTPEREMEGSFSPDGLSFAYAANLPEEGQLDLFLGSLAGGNRVRLTATAGDEFYPQFAPDGGAILFTRADPAVSHTSIWRLSPLGGDERQLVPHGTYGTYSPDGAEIAFSRRGPQGWAVVRRRLADGRELEVARSAHLPASLAWSPDGRSIAFTDGSALWTAPAEGGECRQVGERAETLRSLAWEPSGESLLCDANWAGRANLWRVFLDGRSPEPLTAGSGGVYHPAVSADGWILYTQESQNRRLVLLEVDGRLERALPVKSSADCFALDGVGHRLVFADLDSGTNQTALVLVELETSATRTLLVEEQQAVGCPAFSPDGRRVAVVREAQPRPLWILDLEGSEAETLAFAPGVAHHNRPAWTADGANLLLAAAPAAEAPGIFEIPLAGGPWRRIASGEFRSVAVSPSGHQAAATGSGPEGFGLYLLDLPTGRLRLLAPTASYSSPPVWGMDGEEILVLAEERRRPALRRFDPRGRRREPDLLLEPISTHAFWILLEVHPLADRGWVALQVDLQSDLYLLAPAAQR